MPQVLGFRELGRMDYEPVWHAMQRFTNERGTSAPDEIWLVEHPRLGPWIRDYLDGNGIPLKGKVYAIGLMWLSIGFSCYLVPLPWARGFMLTSAVLVTIYILRQKTLPPR